MRLRDTDMPLDPDVERELEAIDHALRGLRVASDLEDIRDLAVDTRADSPAVEPDFAARLDQWAAAGFPRDGRPGAREVEETDSALSGLLERLRSVPPRRLLVSTGAAATFVVAVAVGIGVSDQLGGSNGGSNGIGIQTAPGAPGTTASSGEAEAQEAHAPSLDAGRASGNTRLKGQFEQFSPQVRSGSSSRDGAFGALGAPGNRAAHRKVAQNANLVLSTEPQNVRDVADGVFGVVDQYNGFVVSSNVTSGRTTGPRSIPAEGDGGRSPEGSGTIELRIPAQHLQDALGDMSALESAHVTSRTEGTIDITKRFDSAKAEVEKLEAKRQSLLNQLADAFTIAEQESIERQLTIVENQLADAKDHLGRVQTRIHLVPVNVEILGERGVDSGGGGAWSIGDAFHDAGRVLTVIAGVLLISAAVLAPLGLIGAVAWITARAVVRRRREDALE
jgi:hypothetical protein